MRETHPVPSMGGVGVTPLGVPPPTVGADTSVAAGAGYVTLQTTVALLAAANTSTRVGFQVDHNQALASLVTRAGDVAFMVAWLNDGTQTIQDLGSGTVASGATPSITGVLVTGVGWQATLDASHRVVLDLARDAVIARNASSRYWIGETSIQVPP